jgi:hypothetical protein
MLTADDVFRRAAVVTILLGSALAVLLMISH